jgi:hypothetical protein
VPVRTSSIAERDTRLAAWWRTPLGRSLLAVEAELLGEAMEDVFGWELLQIGAWGSSRELLAHGRTRRQSLVAAPGFAPGADIIARPAHLPVTSDSIDAALLPHTLEFAPDPYAILREVDRVLVGEGQLLILGFRPFSLWGLRARASRSGFPPGMRRVLSGNLVREWLVLLGYEVVAATRYLYLSPWSRGPSPGKTGRLLRPGITYPLPAGAYLLKARKRLYTMTPIRPRLREARPAVLGELVKPTTRSGL